MFFFVRKPNRASYTAMPKTQHPQSSAAKRSSKARPSSNTSIVQTVKGYVDVLSRTNAVLIMYLFVVGSALVNWFIHRPTPGSQYTGNPLTNAPIVIEEWYLNLKALLRSRNRSVAGMIRSDMMVLKSTVNLITSAHSYGHLLTKAAQIQQIVEGFWSGRNPNSATFILCCRVALLALSLSVYVGGGLPAIQLNYEAWAGSLKLFEQSTLKYQNALTSLQKTLAQTWARRKQRIGNTYNTNSNANVIEPTPNSRRR